MKKLLTLIKFFFAAAAFAASGAAVSADYELRKEKRGKCYNNGKFYAPLQHCHNCRSAGGNRIRWTFSVFCEDQRTKKEVPYELACKKSIPNEGDETRAMYEGAEEVMEELFGWTGDWGDCNLGDWPE